jgi:hypothetical protein
VTEPVEFAFADGGGADAAAAASARFWAEGITTPALTAGIRPPFDAAGLAALSALS